MDKKKKFDITKVLSSYFLLIEFEEPDDVLGKALYHDAYKRALQNATITLNYTRLQSEHIACETNVNRSLQINSLIEKANVAINDFYDL
jgi:hypothetical protein